MRASHILKTGDPIPDLALPALDGGLVNMRDYLGRKYIIYMWASW